MRRAIRASLLGLLLLGGLACTPPGTARPATPGLPSGIRGTVILGPTCATGHSPGAYEPVPCLTPYAAQIVVLNAENRVVARVSSAADGRFEIDLAPGKYVLTPQAGDPYPVAQPVAVTVARGEYVSVEINYDSGIR